ncbi:30S ribosomal protein S2 [bacterium]|nr:30S ribosomal protein S2 [bacterium]
MEKIEKKNNKSKSLTEENRGGQDEKEIEEMFNAGLHFGHRHSKTHPKMTPFIYGMRNNVDIIDLLKTKEYLEKALDYLKEKKKEKPLILFVGTKVSAKKLVKELAEELKMPYVVERWLGGTLTNFEVISKRVQYLKEMEEKKKKGEFEKYPKKERLKINQELEKIEKKMGGLKLLTRLPDLLFVVDVRKEALAIKEARRKGIPIVGICDTDGDPSLVDYPIPANDDAISSLKYILEKVKEALKECNR